MGTRIFVLLLLLIFFIAGGIVWFDYLGLIDAKEMLAPVMGLVGLQKPTVIKDIDDPLLLERERLKKQYEAFDMVEDELLKKENELSAKEKEVSQLVDSVKEHEKEISEKENSFNEKQKAIENRRVNLEQTSEYLVGMPPSNAVAILEQMDDSDIIDIFRVTEARAKKEGEVSMVAFWLSKMSKDRAAVLNRKMARKEGE
jgi:flagellar protein FlbB